MKKLITVLKKELTEVRRDRRSLMAAFAYAAFGPMVVGLVIHMIWANASSDADLRVALANQLEVPVLEQYLTSQGFDIASDANLSLRIADSFREDMAAGRQTTLTITGNLADEEQTVTALRKALTSFGALVAEQRLVARGLVPSAVSPIRIEMEDTALIDGRAESMLTMLLLFFILAPFFSSMSNIIDSTAGERERFSLEALLTRPVSPRLLVTGKWMSGAVIGVLGTAATAIVGKYVLELSPLAELGISLAVEWKAVIMVVMVLLPLACLVAALQLAIALGAKSYKEGHSYLTLLSFAPAVIGFMSTADAGMGKLPVPIFFEMEALGRLFAGSSVDIGLLLAVAATYGTATLLLLLMSARLLGQTRLLEAG